VADFVIRRIVDAKPETVFDVFTDHRGYADLVRIIRSSELEREGQPAPNGVGAIRRLHMPGATVREQVTAYDRPASYSYKMLDGAPLHDYASTVTFTSTNGGTAVAYSVSEEPAVPAGKHIVDDVVKKFIRTFVDKASAQAERNGQEEHGH